MPYFRLLFAFTNTTFFSMFLILLISFNKQGYLEIYFFWTCICTVSKWEECGFGLNKIGSRLEGNWRWQPVVLVEEELHYLSILTVIYPKDIVLLYNHRKDVWYFHQKNWQLFFFD